MGGVIMEKSKKVRALRRLVRKIDHDCNFGIYMDSLMDGSGECGKFYIPGHLDLKHERIEKLFAQLNISQEEYEAELRRYIELEAPFCTMPWNDCPIAYYDISALGCY
jgi:hypothetical protein